MSDTQQGPGWWVASDGKWYPPQPWPQQTQKKGGARGCLAALGVAALVAILLVAVVAIVAADSKPAHPAARDVMFVTCDHPDSAGWHATVRVLNHSSKASNYVMTIEWDDVGGARLQSGLETINALGPGQAATGQVIAPTPVAGGNPVTCRAVSVTRLAA